MSTTLALALVLATAGSAEATVEPGAEPVSTPVATSTPAEPASAWYGQPILVADVAALGLVLTGLASSRSSPTAAKVLVLGGLATYGLGGPIVHLAHDNPGRALGSVGLRVGMPVVAGLIGIAVEKSSCQPAEWFCGVAGMTLGGLAGIAGAVAVDAAVLAWAPRADVKVAPMLGGGRLGMQLGGTF